jgi:hypothetical protein
MTSAFITSPHLPPQAVVFKVAVWARRTAGAATAARAPAPPATNRRRVICRAFMTSSYSMIPKSGNRFSEKIMLK